ncbi:MAG: hypothetical protein IK083_02645 [Abditibacteriota bacterium]|nr:hypothetical protein [Abditibacteriota bacterium]
MKNLLTFLTIALVFCCVSAAYAAYTMDPDKRTMRRELISLPVIPDYLLTAIGDPGDLYIPEIKARNRDISKAKLITVYKGLVGKSLWDENRTFLFYSGTFLSDNNEDIEKICNMIPLVKRTILYDRFEVMEYDADKYINWINKDTGSAFSIVKDNGKIIWYYEGEVPLDVAITKNGRYMISTEYSDFFVNLMDDKIICEMYSGNRDYFGNIPRPANVRILTDNVIRVSYKSGLVEHWKVRLSEEDLEKNMEKYKTDEKHLADKCLLWSNGKGKPYKSQAMWCYNESDQEPVYDNTNLADITADISDVQSSVSAPAPDKRPNEKAAAAPKVQNEKPEARAATGWLAGLVARVKSWFAGLFA